MCEAAPGMMPFAITVAGLPSPPFLSATWWVIHGRAGSEHGTPSSAIV
jgi:hypothetical protein